MIDEKKVHQKVGQRASELALLYYLFALVVIYRFALHFALAGILTLNI